MKTLHSLLALAAISLLLAGAATLRAGPPPGYQDRMRSVVSKPAPARTVVVIADPNKLPAGCATMTNCACAAAAGRKAS